MARKCSQALWKREYIMESMVHFLWQTYPEIIPFIEVCVKMMEQVYNVPVDIDTPTAAQPSQVKYNVTLMTLYAHPFVHVCIGFKYLK
jgi:hypothetical protein